MSPTLTMNPKRKHKRKLLILPMVKSHYPRCLQCFPTQEILTTKTLNPKVTSFVIQVSLSSSSPSKSAKKHLYSSLQLSKSCHVCPNRDTFDTYDPRYDQPYPENVPSKPKIVSRFPKIVPRLYTSKTCFRHSQNRDTLMKSCHDFSVSQNHKFEAKNNILHLDF
jgi:hypothetical protein